MARFRFSAVPIAAVILSLLLVATSVLSGGAPAFRTGAPGELTCADARCHVSNLVNTGDGSVSIEGPSSYLGGVPVNMIVRATRPGAARFGFEITVQDANGSMAGAWEVTAGTNFAEFGNAPAYLTHAPFAPRATDTYSWAIKWIPPAANGGDVIFYAAVNTANGDTLQFNDFIYTTSFPMSYAGDTSVIEQNIPVTLQLHAAYPNPAASEFSVSFDLMSPANVNLYLYDGLGRIQVQTETETLSTGTHQLRVPTSNLKPGVYSYRIEASGHSKMGTIAIAR